MGDNGWLFGEYGMMSKVFFYEELMWVLMVIFGLDVLIDVCDDLVLNIDFVVIIYEIVGFNVFELFYGCSLFFMLIGRCFEDWWISFLYEVLMW